MNHPVICSPVPPALDIQHLTTRFIDRDKPVYPVNDVSLSVRPGEILGLVGESGSGKSMTGYSIMGLLEPPGEIIAGEMLLGQVDLRRLDEEGMRRVRGNRLAMIFQDPMLTLNPVLRIDTQLVETVLAHRKVGKKEALALARAALVRVGIAAPDQRLRAYPHQFSGGMRQRLAIAIALLNQPELIICDEPTTALDVTIQAQILYEMQMLCRNAGTALIWITHDLSVVAGLADNIAVMYAGRIVEAGPASAVLSAPRHPYTFGLMASTPGRHTPGQPLHQIPGAAPALHDLDGGCAFRPRCPHATDQCLSEPPETMTDGRSWRCFHPLSVTAGAA